MSPTQQLKTLDPRSVWVFFFQHTVLGIVLTLVFFPITFIIPGLTASPEALLVKALVSYIVLVAIGVLLTFLWAHLFYRSYKYELREDSYRSEWGVIWKHYGSIPYERIQNVEITRGLIDRVFGLSRLHIQTAGYSGANGTTGFRAGSEGDLPGLLPQDAENLREELIHRARSST